QYFLSHLVRKPPVGRPATSPMPDPAVAFLSHTLHQPPHLPRAQTSQFRRLFLVDLLLQSLMNQVQSLPFVRSHQQHVLSGHHPLLSKKESILTLFRGHFYFGLTGHYHFGMTQKKAGQYFSLPSELRNHVDG